MQITQLVQQLLAALKGVTLTQDEIDMGVTAGEEQHALARRAVAEAEALVQQPAIKDSLTTDRQAEPVARITSAKHYMAVELLENFPNDVPNDTPLYLAQPVARDVLMAAMRAAVAECAEICDVYSAYKGARCALEIRHPIMNGKLADIADRYAAQPPAVAVAVPDEAKQRIGEYLTEELPSVAPDIDWYDGRYMEQLVDGICAAMLAAAPQAATEGCGACGDGCQGRGCRLERESPPTCQTCNGKGMIGGLLPNGGGYDGEPCPDCNAPQATAEDSSVVQAGVAVPAEWPTAQDVGRIGDMSQVASLRVGLDADNDVYVSIANEEGMADVEFCVPGSGGGKSPRTRAALIALMVAMEADNAESPSRDWWKARECDAQKGGAA